MIYLDYNGTAPFSTKVVEYLTTEALNDWGNPSSEHDWGFNSKAKLSSMREQIAQSLDCEPGQLSFTSGATESIGTVLGPENLKKHRINTIISTPTEHSATLANLDFLAKLGFNVSFARVLHGGCADLEDLDVLAGANPGALISILYANNETGVLNDIDAIKQISSRHKARLHVDAVQAWGKTPLSLEGLRADFVSLSGHKIGSLKGIGVLYSRSQQPFVEPLIRGGGQERGARAGTSNLVAARSLAIAARSLRIQDLSSVTAVRDQFEQQVCKKIQGAYVHGIDSQRIPNTSSLCFPGVDAKRLMLALGRRGIMVSTGSACTSGTEKPSYVISSFAGADAARATLRISFPFDAAIRTIDATKLACTFEDSYQSVLSDS